MNSAAASFPKRAYYCSLAAAISATFIYLPVLRHEFINYDDFTYILNNPNLGLFYARDFISWAFTASLNASWQPVTWMSYGLDYSIWGKDPAGYHLTNLLIHAINAFLLTLLAWRLFERAFGGDNGRLWIGALVVGAGFAVHPLQVEAVAWVSERKGLLCALFTLLTMLAYERYTGPVGHGRKGRALYILSVLAHSFALMSKPVAITMPAVLLIMDFYPLRRLSRKPAMRLAEKIPYALLSLASLAIAFGAHVKSEALALNWSLTTLDKVKIACSSLFFYLSKFAFPKDLSPFYLFDIYRFDPTRISYYAAVVGFALVTLTVAWLHRRRPYLAALWLAYVTMLLPVLGFVRFGMHNMANRYMYLPIALPLLLIGALATKTYAKGPAIRRGIAALLVLAALSFASMSVNYLAVWKDSLTFFSYVSTINPKDFRTQYNLAIIYLDDKKYEKAIVHLSRALQLNPMYPDAYYGRAYAYAMIGLNDNAIADLKRHLSIEGGMLSYNVGHQLSLQLLGDLYMKQRRPSEAIDAYKRLVGLAPSAANARLKLADAYTESGDFANAMDQLRAALKLNPAQAEAREKLEQLKKLVNPS